MKIIVLKDNSLKGSYGIYSALDPISLPDGTFFLPVRCLTDKDLSEAHGEIITMTERETDILPLPKIGGECVKDVVYQLPDELINEELSPLVICVQTHNRTIYEPKDTPALFSFFRENTDELLWIPNEWVKLGWKRIYNGVTYTVIQAHQTLSTWTPDVTPALWHPEVIPDIIPVWKQPTGAHDAYNKGDKVHFPKITDPVYESLINANVWSPAVYPAGWKKL